MLREELMKPFYMWAGGKTKTIKHYEPIFPRDFDSYVEPFFGGGAIYAWLNNLGKLKNPVINDVNSLQ